MGPPSREIVLEKLQTTGSSLQATIFHIWRKWTTGSGLAPAWNNLRLPLGKKLLIPASGPHILMSQRMDPVGERIAGKRRYQMPRSTYFVQECPTCGRNLQVRVEYLGKQIVCQHCSARFEACEPGSEAYPPPNSSLSLLDRAEHLLQTASASGIGLAASAPSRPR
jgi:DNA-directed RNA polymerase subunit RPC12/RpoP